MQLLSQMYPKEFEKIFVKMFSKDILFKSINSGTKLICEITDRCCYQIIYNIKADILDVFPSLITFKNPTIRQKAAEYMRLILARYPKETILKDIELVESFLQSVLTDANEECWRQARLAWFEFEKCFEFRGSRLMELFDY